MSEPLTGVFTPQCDGEAALPNATPSTGNSTTSPPTNAGLPATRVADVAASSATVQRGGYTIERLHAQGGLGRVNVAREARLNRQVALKEIRADRRDAEARRRFVKEAE